MGTHPIFESDFDCLTGFRMLARLSRPIFNQSKRNGGHFFTVETAQFWKYMSIFGGGGFCLMAFENAERRLKPYEERIEFRERPNHMAGRNTKFPFSQEHPERNLFYNPAVNANAFKGYETMSDVSSKLPPVTFTTPQRKPFLKLALLRPTSLMLSGVLSRESLTRSSITSTRKSSL